MAITATDCPVKLDLLPRENGDWVQMAPNRILVESIGPVSPPILGDDGEPLSPPEPSKRRHLWVDGTTATQQAPIDEQVRDDQPETVIVGVDASASGAELGNAAWVIAQLIAHLDLFAVKRRPDFALRLSESDPTSNVNVDLPTNAADELRAAIAAALS